MVSQFSEIELDLFSVSYPVPNYPKEQKKLWRKIRDHSTCSSEVLDRIESMLPEGRFYDSYQDYACYGAALYAIGTGLTSPFAFKEKDNKQLLERFLIKKEKLQQRGSTLI